ncbi:hypothetical protein E2562_031667 [Oryza meyeriana var. granulata]|uniref:F-box domain-containing protein n=1 Tax=Oryza meyeriana var. granulata TaxID=110450 RepID=A0A6G1E5H6_9ORYZ|nr:hypothetical protein E2562_031667 [Oryza meyeriana var. granulata]
MADKKRGGYFSLLAPVETTPTIKPNADQDRISHLPDDILLAILDGLNVRDAARTSLLSRRWRPLPAMISHLKIDISDFDPKGMSRFSDDELGRTNAAVVEATKSILACRKSNENTIYRLSMRFYLRDDDCISIGHTVGHTMGTQKVEMIEFTVLTEKGRKQRILHDDLVTYGRRFELFFSSCPNTFRGLTGLQLENLRFGELEISDVLNTCNRLKYLHLFNCNSGISTFLEVEHLQLSELSIVSCRFERIKLSSLPKLTRIIFGGWLAFQDPLSFGHVPLLESVVLTNVGLSWHKVVKLSNFLSNAPIRDLTLDFNSEKIWVQPEGPKALASAFHKLRVVNLVDLPEGYDPSWTLFILEAAPSLRELYMAVRDHLCEMETNTERRKAISYSENKNVDWNASATDFKNHSLSTGKNPRPVRYPSTKKQRFALRNRISLGTHSLALIHFPSVLKADHRARLSY